MKIVKQEEKCGCTIACIATVLNLTYKQVRKDFVNDFENEGMKLKNVASYLADHGKQIIHKSELYYSHKDFGRAEMLKPFAPVHIVSIKQSFDHKNGHVVVMDKKGKLFCPDGLTDEEVRNSYLITDTLGIY